MQHDRKNADRKSSTVVATVIRSIEGGWACTQSSFARPQAQSSVDFRNYMRSRVMHSPDHFSRSGQAQSPGEP